MPETEEKPAIDLKDEAVLDALAAAGWHHKDAGVCEVHCGNEHCGEDDCACTAPEPLLGEADPVVLARAFEQLHRQAHPAQPQHIALCTAEPCRSLTWAVADAISKAA